MLEIPGVDHVYTMSGDGYAMVTVRFKVGEDQERSVTKVQAKLAGATGPGAARCAAAARQAALDRRRAGPRAHAALGGYDANALRQIAMHLEDEIRTVPDVAETFVVGGQPKQIRVTLDPARLAASGVTPGEVAMALQRRERAAAGRRARDCAIEVYRIDVGAPLATAAEVGSVVVAVRGGAPVYLRNVADVTRRVRRDDDYVSHAGRAARRRESGGDDRRGQAEGRQRHAGDARGAGARGRGDRARLLPRDVQRRRHPRLRRDGGREGAASSSCISLIATLSVTVLIWLFLGWREALVVLVAVPVTLALTLFAYYALGYTLNRITLFALIFSIGILVDDAIVVVENIYRHLKMGDRAPEVAAVEAVDEVGQPDDPRHVHRDRGDPADGVRVGHDGAVHAADPGRRVGGDAGLARPWRSSSRRISRYRLLKGHVARTAHPHDRAHEEEETSRFGAAVRAHHDASHGPPRRARSRSTAASCAAAGRLGRAGAREGGEGQDAAVRQQERVPGRARPAGGHDARDDRTRSARRSRRICARVPEVTSTEVYAGTAAPFNFNGLVRHYFMRRGRTSPTCR